MYWNRILTLLAKYCQLKVWVFPLLLRIWVTNCKMLTHCDYVSMKHACTEIGEEICISHRSNFVLMFLLLRPTKDTEHKAENTFVRTGCRYSWQEQSKVSLLQGSWNCAEQQKEAPLETYIAKMV